MKHDDVLAEIDAALGEYSEFTLERRVARTIESAAANVVHPRYHSVDEFRPGVIPTDRSGGCEDCYMTPGLECGAIEKIEPALEQTHDGLVLVFAVYEAIDDQQRPENLELRDTPRCGRRDCACYELAPPPEPPRSLP